jgi:predicted aspartyl protease
MKSLDARARLAALGLLVLINVSCPIVVRAAEGAVGLRLLGGRLPVVPVYLDGRGPFDFLLDTGTNSTIVTPEVAAVLDLRPEDRVTLITAAGARDVPRARLHRVAVGGSAAADVEALVSGLEELRRLDPRLCGVLGQNFLGRFDYTLDYGGRTLEFDVAGEGEPPSGERVPYALEEGKLIVAARAEAYATRALRLVLDGAATSLVIFEDARSGYALTLPSGGSGMLLTEAGSLEVGLARLRSLRVGGTCLRDVPVALVRDSAARAEDGLLPTSLFRAVYFNHGGGYVIFNPKRGGRAREGRLMSRARAS